MLGFFFDLVDLDPSANPVSSGMFFPFVIFVESLHDYSFEEEYFSKNYDEDACIDDRLFYPCF